MLQGANTDLFNPLVPKAHKSKCQNLLFPIQIKPVNVNPAPTPLVVNFARNVKFGMDIKLGVLTHNMR